MTCFSCQRESVCVYLTCLCGHLGPAKFDPRQCRRIKTRSDTAARWWLNAFQWRHKSVSWKMVQIFMGCTWIFFFYSKEITKNVINGKLTNHTDAGGMKITYVCSPAVHNCYCRGWPSTRFGCLHLRVQTDTLGALWGVYPLADESIMLYRQKQKLLSSTCVIHCQLWY
jgi:hypothetical protein